ncbi:ATP-binding cassette domain-containing protein [Shouchella patagoniensis]|uniref:ATP-binding cassette domain-containing protein n=1 Tax=Shouchella patagoniensis TaxID=228576 RepID=UPI0014744D25|nr:ATP-binding cassette domain-containing protein [Shouchella patagoniensis]
MNTISIKGIDKKYGRKRVFANLNAELNQNRFVVLLGANGVGKSTFLKLCAGLAPIGKGQIELNEKSSRLERTKISSYVSEESGFEPYKTAATILSDHTVLFDTFQLNQAKEMCAHIGLPLQTKWGVLSKGQRHLLSLIVAIASPKPFIFIDEVLANLDTTKKKAMLGMLTDFVIEEDRMILIATHAYEDVEMLADGVMFLQKDNADVINDLDEWRFKNNQSLKELFAEVGKE